LTWLTNHHPSVLWRCWLGHLTRKIVSEMTYNVSSGTLNTTILYSLLSSPLSSSITPSLFHSRLKTYTFSTNPSHLRLLLPIGLPSWQWDWTGPIMLIVLFLVSHFNFLFVPCGGLSWLPVSFSLYVKYTLSYRIVSYRIVVGLCRSCLFIVFFLFFITNI